jgi:hypothetical protein
MGYVLKLVGKKFGRLIVIERAGSSARGDSMWLCRCDCGNEKKVQGKLLTHVNEFSRNVHPAEKVPAVMDGYVGDDRGHDGYADGDHEVVEVLGDVKRSRPQMKKPRF